MPTISAAWSIYQHITRSARRCGARPSWGEHGCHGLETEILSNTLFSRDPSRGAVIRIGDSIELYVLNPPADTDESGNAASLVMNVKQGKFNLLLTGDIDRSTG